MKNTAWGLVLLTLALTGACVLAVVDSRFPERSSLPAGEFYETLTLHPGERISLENGDGNVEVRGWGEEKAEIFAQERRRFSGYRGIRVLGWRWNELDIDLERTEEGLRIKTRLEDEDAGREVNYHLRVPRSIRLDSLRNGRGDIVISDVYGRLRVDSRQGNLQVKNFSGSLEARSGRGRVEAEVLDLRPEDEIRLTLDEGDIVLFLEPDVAAEFDAEAPEGKISSEIDLGQALPASRISTKLAEGKALIHLLALRGDIRLRKVEK